LIEEVFDIRIQPVADDHLQATTWHPDAKLYSVRDHRDQFVGHFYFDPYARSGQKLLSREAAAWMIGFRNKSQLVGHTPSAAVVLNLTPPLHGIPSLLSFDQVQTLFSKVTLYDRIFFEN
jgi:Zn-dependent oligopeptidase